MPFDRKLMSPKTGSCMARGPNLSALRTPVQFGTGCGSLQRKFPVGAAAKGTPLNVLMPDSFTPSNVPLEIFTVGVSLFNCAVTNKLVNSNTHKKKRFFFIIHV